MMTMMGVEKSSQDHYDVQEVSNNKQSPKKYKRCKEVTNDMMPPFNARVVDEMNNNNCRGGAPKLKFWVKCRWRRKNESNQSINRMNEPINHVINSDWILVSPPSPRNPSPDGIMTCQCNKRYDWSIGVAEEVRKLLRCCVR
jgi:hypothetical protein